MAQAIISRRGRGSGSGSGYVTITFNGVSALKRTGAAALVWPRQNLAATTVGDYALFGGGYSGGTTIATMDAYDTRLINSIPEFLVEPRHFFATTTVGNYALFGSSTKSETSATVN